MALHPFNRFIAQHLSGSVTLDDLSRGLSFNLQSMLRILIRFPASVCVLWAARGLRTRLYSSSLILSGITPNIYLILNSWVDVFPNTFFHVGYYAVLFLLVLVNYKRHVLTFFQPDSNFFLPSKYENSAISRRREQSTPLFSLLFFFSYFSSSSCYYYSYSLSSLVLLLWSWSRIHLSLCLIGFFWASVYVTCKNWKKRIFCGFFRVDLFSPLNEIIISCEKFVVIIPWRQKKSFSHFSSSASLHQHLFPCGWMCDDSVCSPWSISQRVVGGDNRDEIGSLSQTLPGVAMLRNYEFN